MEGLFFNALGQMKSLDELNQYIWINGFDSIALTQLDKFANLVYNGTCIFERIPQAQQHGLSRGSSLLCEVAIVCRGCPETESEVREIYDTGDLIGESEFQERLIELWARKRGVWIDNPEASYEVNGVLRDEGTESIVYFEPESRIVTKLISSKYYNIPRLLIDRIIIHNAIFPDSALNVVGFGRDSYDRFVVIAQQPYIEGSPISSSETLEFMLNMGFDSAGHDYGMNLNYKTDNLYVGDLNEFNVIKGERGIHVIDAVCLLNVSTLNCGGSYLIPKVNVDFTLPCFLDL